jgi:hypothetical protein
MLQFHKPPEGNQNYWLVIYSWQLTPEEQHWLEGQEAPPAAGPQLDLLFNASGFGDVSCIDSSIIAHLIGLWDSGMHASITEDSRNSNQTDAKFFDNILI